MNRIKLAEKIIVASRRLKEATDNRVSCARQYTLSVEKELKAIKELEELNDEMLEII